MRHLLETIDELVDWVIVGGINTGIDVNVLRDHRAVIHDELVSWDASNA